MENDSDRPVEIKDLNKTQLILLALLLSFVTSIATGIVTVTLMQQAPTGVTQTINRVVQQTIEKVVPDYSPNKTQTVVVKEDDLVVDAVGKTRANFADLLAAKDSTEALSQVYSIGAGTFISTDATIDPTTSYIIREGKTLFSAKVTGVSPLGFSLLAITNPDTTVASLSQGSLGKDVDVKVGQTLVIVTTDTISKGLVQAIHSAIDKDTADTIEVSPNPGGSAVGGYAVDLDGDVAGLVLSKSDGSIQIVGADAVTAFIATLSKPALPAPPITAPTQS